MAPKKETGKRKEIIVRKFFKVTKEAFTWIIVFMFGIFAAKIINDYVIIKAEVPTGSMESTIKVGDQLIGLRLAYLSNEPQRGDIVLFPYPDNPEVVYVKRVIGLPGETVEIKNGYTYINGNPIEESYLKEEMVGEFGPYEVPEGHYFMMGDNRNGSHDSRKWDNPYVAEENIMAKVIFRHSPDFHWFSDVTYEE